MENEITKNKLHQLSKKQLDSLTINVINQAFNEGNVFEAGVVALAKEYKTKQKKVELILGLFDGTLSQIRSNESGVEEAKKEILDTIEYFTEKENNGN